MPFNGVSRHALPISLSKDEYAVSEEFLGESLRRICFTIGGISEAEYTDEGIHARHWLKNKSSGAGYLFLSEQTCTVENSRIIQTNERHILKSLVFAATRNIFERTLTFLDGRASALLQPADECIDPESENSDGFQVRNDAGAITIIAPNYLGRQRYSLDDSNNVSLLGQEQPPLPKEDPVAEFLSALDNFEDISQARVTLFENLLGKVDSKAVDGKSFGDAPSNYVITLSRSCESGYEINARITYLQDSIEDNDRCVTEIPSAQRYCKTVKEDFFLLSFDTNGRQIARERYQRKDLLAPLKAAECPADRGETAHVINLIRQTKPFQQDDRTLQSSLEVPRIFEDFLGDENKKRLGPSYMIRRNWDTNDGLSYSLDYWPTEEYKEQFKFGSTGALEHAAMYRMDQSGQSCKAATPKGFGNRHVLHLNAVLRLQDSMTRPENVGGKPLEWFSFPSF